MHEIEHMKEFDIHWIMMSLDSQRRWRKLEED